MKTLLATASLLLGAAPAHAQTALPSPLAPPAPIAAANGQASTQASPVASAAAEAAPTQGYVLGAGDTIEISVLGTDTFNVRTQVQQDGTIALPLIDTVTAAGKTAQQLRNEIAGKLRSGGYFARPAVNLTVTSPVSRTATILGQVRTPGVVILDRPYRLSEVVARVGGLKDQAIDAITLTHRDGSSQKVSLRQIATSGPEADPVLVDGDKVFVAPPETFYIYGQVNAPGAYPIVEGMTVRMALARGGGLTALGSQNKVKLIRNDRELKVRLSEPLLAGDVIDVGERFF
ncbi:polysaccharide biosynthesis/export family protein [Novosphingobium huizhouense]|uniref:polysaccharide biosynthesis/export family protein n=1 Tax=Novosphingobium huizhouense TaxID=2866625 RepID=UPI001CD8DA18|nr:polysaccharide biosynthesis/export family protein [Novosphingobium huizhouense]